MTVRMEGRQAYLEGDWTASHVEENMNSLMRSLKQVETSGERGINIDCGKIDEADTSGLQPDYIKFREGLVDPPGNSWML